MIQYSKEQITQAIEVVKNLNKHFGYEVEVTEQDAIHWLNTKKQIK